MCQKGQEPVKAEPKLNLAPTQLPAYSLSQTCSTESAKMREQGQMSAQQELPDKLRETSFKDTIGPKKKKKKTEKGGGGLFGKLLSKPPLFCNFLVSNSVRLIIHGLLILTPLRTNVTVLVKDAEQTQHLHLRQVAQGSLVTARIYQLQGDFKSHFILRRCHDFTYNKQVRIVHNKVHR